MDNFRREALDYLIIACGAVLGILVIVCLFVVIIPEGIIAFFVGLWRNKWSMWITPRILRFLKNNYGVETFD